LDPARFRLLEAAFEEACALTGPAREQWLAEHEATDADLAAEVRTLLAAEATTGVLDRLGAQMSPLPRLLAEASGSSIVDPTPLPAQVGPYVVTGEIGRGGVGIVWRAHDPRLGRDVALKVFPHAALESGASDTERRVLAEARAASALDHPNICTIYDVGTLSDGRPYLAMAFYPGGTLADRLAAGPLPVREATTIAAQIADALACAHAAGIVHRDVKPRNIAFGERGESKLLDFGIALLRDRGDEPHSAGTPAYMAPEQVRCESVDERADVWGLGVVLYEMLTGRRPFVGADRASLQRAILHDEPGDVRTLRDEVPAALAELVGATLRKAPAERPSGASEVATTLRALLTEFDTKASEGERPARLRGRRRQAAIALAAGAAALTAGLYAWRQPDEHLAATSGAAADVRAPDGPGSIPASIDLDVRELFLRARERYNTREPQATEQTSALLRTVLSRAPDFPQAHALLARTHLRSMQLGQRRQGRAESLDSALAHAREAIALGPRVADGYGAVGEVLAAKGQHAEAVTQYRRALDLDPRHAQTMLALANSYVALDQFEEGFVWMERSLAIDPALPDGRMLAVGRYTAWNMTDHARRHLDAGLRVDPSDPQLQSQGIILDLWVEDTVSATRRFEAVMPFLAPVEQARLRAWFALRRGDLATARREADRVVASGSTLNDPVGFGAMYRLTGARTVGDSLLRRALETQLTSDRLAGARSSRMAAVIAYTYAVLGDRELALRELARSDSLGGLALAKQVAREPGWDAVRNDPRFIEITARADARLHASRARILARLAEEGLVAPTTVPVR